MNAHFSVIVPAFNAEKTIGRCLDSLIKQIKGHSAEIIVINDGSTDDTEMIVREYQQRFPMILYDYQENAGVSVARNRGLELSTGKYISFVDSDDYVLDHYFDILESFEDHDLVVFPYISKRDNEMIKHEKWIKSISGNTKQMTNEIIITRVSSPWNKRFKRDIIIEHQIRFDPDLYLGEDFLFNLEYMLFCKSITTNQCCLYCVDESGNDSLTRAKKNNFYSQQTLMYQKAFNLIRSCDWNDDEKAALLQSVDYIFCRTVFACAEDAVECSENNALKKIQPIVDEFHNIKPDHVEALNMPHRVMQWIILRKNTLAVLLAAKGHYLIKKHIV